MGMSQALLPEFDQEMANTRKTLERVPEDRLGWRPHPPPEPRTRQELLSTFDRNRDAARAAIERADDARFARPWTLMKAGRTIFTLPRAAVMRSFVMNHVIHHRAPLGVYLSLNDVPVPALYGPSADEGAM